MKNFSAARILFAAWVSPAADLTGHKLLVTFAGIGDTEVFVADPMI